MIDRVDFYLLKSPIPQERWLFACRLTEKAYLRSMSVLVSLDTETDAKLLDDMLWTFGERSFVPHQLCIDSQVPDPATPVHLTLAQGTVEQDSTQRADLLVNLSQRLHPRLDQFQRVAEIINPDEEQRRLGRERFKSYRDLKVKMETHDY